jgi:uncharacterized protein YndB with AHSA1/START domain
MSAVKPQSAYSLKTKLEYEIEIAAPVDAVWKALTDAAELTRWFPLDATVKPGAGGTVRLSWGPEYEGTSNISIWEPNKHLQCSEGAPPAPGETDAKGRVMVLDWVLESKGGKTVLRLVHSGFAGADWEEEYFESVKYGWTFMLTNLRHYMERHLGVPRLVAWPRKKVEMPREAIFQKLMARDGLFVEPAIAHLREGERYSLRTATGNTFSGKVEFLRPPRGFCVTVESLNDALFWLTIEGSAGNYEPQLWLSAYGLPAWQVAAFGAQWSGLLNKLFAAQG